MFPFARLRALVVSLVLLTACQGSPGEHEEPTKGPSGSVWFQLAAEAESGTLYRLHGATFSISGPKSVQLATNDESDDVLRTTLPVGAYRVELMPGWRLVRMDDGQEVRASLHGENPALANIQVADTTLVAFAFDLAGGDQVGFGDLGIGITVNDNDSEAAEEPAEDADPAEPPADPREPPLDSDERADSDGDGVRDLDDNCPGRPNPRQPDHDADGLGDACDRCPADASPDLGQNCLEDGRARDTDADAVLDALDNCPATSNPGQLDSDADGVGDHCDNCRFIANRAQQDSDGDGNGDACACETSGRCD
jgi:hypothetical protein